MIDAKMEQLHAKNKEACLLKVAIDGHVLNLDMEPIKELAAMLRHNGNNCRWSVCAGNTRATAAANGYVGCVSRHITDFWKA